MKTTAPLCEEPTPDVLSTGLTAEIDEAANAIDAEQIGTDSALTQESIDEPFTIARAIQKFDHWLRWKLSPSGQ